MTLYLAGRGVGHGFALVGQRLSQKFSVKAPLRYHGVADGLQYRFHSIS